MPSMPFCRNSKISGNSSDRFLWNFAEQKTSTQYGKRQAFLKKMPMMAAIRFRAETIVTSLSRDILIAQK